MSSTLLAFQLGDRVLIEGSSSNDRNEGFERSGIIRYIGKTEFKEGDWLGVELDSPTGKNDGSVAGVRYFSCEPFHGLFVPPNKARLNLSGDSKFGETMFSNNSRRLSSQMAESFLDSRNAELDLMGTPNHLDKIENFQMDFSAVKDISDSFMPTGLKTPTANVKSQNHTPATTELKNTQKEIMRLRDQIMSIKSDLRNESDSSRNKETINSIVSKLSGMLETYEQVSAQYENQLKQFLMARKAGKLDVSSSSSSASGDQLKEELEKIRSEHKKVQGELYHEISTNESLRRKVENFDEDVAKLKSRIMQLEDELQKAHYESSRSRTELEIELSMEEERRKRSLEHENELKLLKARHDEELRQKKILISDLQNEVAFLKQSEKVLEEELNSRRFRLDQSSESSVDEQVQKLSDELFSAKRQVDEYKRLWEDAQGAKNRAEEYYRSELERARKESVDNSQFEELRQDLKELGGRLKQTRADNEELTWALETSRKETERLNMVVEEQALKLTDREKKLQAFSERIKDLESREVESRDMESLRMEVKRLNVELGEERVKAAAPLEHISALKRKIMLIEREKELLEEQMRTMRLSAFSKGEFQTFSTFIQGLKRHIEAEILSIEPLKLTLQDVVRAKEMVDILLKVTDDVRVKVLNHLSQVEEVIKARFSTPSTSEIPTNQNHVSGNSSVSEAETVKIDRVRNYDSNSLADLKRRIDFRSEIPIETASRSLREPLGVTSIPGASNILQQQQQQQRRMKSSADFDLENRMNNFRSMVSDLRSRQNYSHHPPSSSAYHRSSTNSSNFIRAHEPIRCNLCSEYGHDALACPDYLGGADSFSEESFLKDVRNSRFDSRFAEKTRV